MLICVRLCGGKITAERSQDLMDDGTIECVPGDTTMKTPGWHCHRIDRLSSRKASLQLNLQMANKFGAGIFPDRQRR